MNTHFFKNKMKEVRNFLKIIRGRVKEKSQHQQKEYLREKQEAENKVLRETGGQDISAI